MNKIKLLIAFLLLGVSFMGCERDEPSPELVKPAADNVEIGYANNKQAIRGRDFHFNADVIAGDKISVVMVKILPKTGQAYATEWHLELDWEEFKGAKNTNVHKHFIIPAEAPGGIYDFLFIVHDENGTTLELKEDLVIIDAVNMPVDPIVDRDIFSRNDEMIYYMGTYVEDPLVFKKGDKFTARAQIKQIQGDGILYAALIKRKSNHFPETISQLDINKAIIVSKTEHTGLGPASKINTYKLINGELTGDEIVIGADQDILGNPVTRVKAWDSGEYHLVILYHNSTYNMSTHKSIPITIQLTEAIK